MFRRIIVIINIVLICACASPISQLPADVEQQQLLSLQQSAEDFLLLDVRSVDEFNQAHIPGAVNISHLELLDNLTSVNTYKNKNIIVYCRSGRRAAIAIDTLKKNGFNQVHHLSGDMLAWQDANLAIKVVEE